MHIGVGSANAMAVVCGVCTSPAPTEKRGKFDEFHASRSDWMR